MSEQINPCHNRGEDSECPGCGHESHREEPLNDFQKEFSRLFSQLEEGFRENNIEKASTSMNALWVFFQIYATAATTELKELTYLKTPFTFDKGGKYLLTFMHVDGPKIQLKADSGNAYTKKFEEVK